MAEINPEQSYMVGPVPPYWYGFPLTDSANCSADMMSSRVTTKSPGPLGIAPPPAKPGPPAKPSGFQRFRRSPHLRIHSSRMPGGIHDGNRTSSGLTGLSHQSGEG